MLGIPRDADGWFTEADYNGDPTGTQRGGVYVAGVCQGPKDIPDAVAQGAAAAARVDGMISKGTVLIEPVVATIDADHCSGCRICNNLCPFGAIEFVEDDKVSKVNAVLCKGCGTCVAACPAGAIAGAHFSDAQILAELEGLLRDTGGGTEAAAGPAETPSEPAIV